MGVQVLIESTAQVDFYFIVVISHITKNVYVSIPKIYPRNHCQAPIMGNNMHFFPVRELKNSKKIYFYVSKTLNYSSMVLDVTVKLSDIKMYDVINARVLALCRYRHFGNHYYWKKLYRVLMGNFRLYVELLQRHK